jgi:hypothetical protein
VIVAARRDGVSQVLKLAEDRRKALKAAGEAKWTKPKPIGPLERIRIEQKLEREAKAAQARLAKQQSQTCGDAAVQPNEFHDIPRDKVEAVTLNKG